MFFFTKFNKHQLNYSTIKKEALALICGLQHFEVYVGGGLHPVVVFTDHNPLTFIHSLQNSNQRLMRWALFLQPYNLVIRHIRGQENDIAIRSAYLMVNIVLKDKIPSSIFILKCLPKSTLSHQGYCINTTAS